MSTKGLVLNRSHARRPVVSVVITTRDRSDLVQAAVASVLALDDSNFELDLVVVDDGSVDDTPDVLAALPVRVVRTTGLGIAGARNTGLHAARGEFVNLLDDDDLLLPDAITSRLAAFRADHRYGAVIGRAQRTHSDLTPFGEPFPSAGARSGWIFEDLLTYQPQIGTVLYRTSAVLAIGGYNPRYAGDDEWDLHLRLAKAFPIGQVDATVMLFRQRTDAEEEQQWRRTRRVREIYHLNTDHLDWRKRVRLLRVRSRILGWNSYQFTQYAVTNWRHHEYWRASKSLWYAARWSPLHIPTNLWRLSRTPS